MGFHRSVVCADEAIVVTTPHVSSIRDSEKVVGILGSYRLSEIYSVINKVRGDLILDGDMADTKEIFDRLATRPLGVIPDDDSVTFRELKELKGAADSAIKMIAQNLHNGAELMFDCSVKYKGFLGKLRRSLKRNA